LGLTALSKLGSLVLPSAQARLEDRNLVFPFLSEGEVLLVAAVVEIAVIAVYFRAKNRWVRFGFMAWLSLVFLAYHSTMVMYRRPCDCAGAVRSDSFLASPGFTLTLLILLMLSAGIGLGAEFLGGYAGRRAVARQETNYERWLWES